LDAFAGDVAGDGGAVGGFSTNFINLIYIDDAGFGAFDIVVGILKQSQNNGFNIFADVAGFGDGGGVGDAEGDVEDFCEGAGKESFAAAGGADEKDVAFFDFDFVEVAGFRSISMKTFVVIMHSDGEDAFGFVLTDNVFVEFLTDFDGFWDAGIMDVVRSWAKFFVEDAFTDEDAAVADVDAGAGDKFTDFVDSFVAKRTHG
jgi:hypothetical protein